ncbi:MAG TPA: hypothetical protein VFG19_01990 [Geobacteraceae bacterium]|nr:hypothetical protein [Geobacteraceae bacterium]
MTKYLTNLNVHKADTAYNFHDYHEGDSLVLSAVVSLKEFEAHMVELKIVEHLSYISEYITCDLEFMLGKEQFLPNLSEPHVQINKNKREATFTWIWDTTGIRGGTYNVRAKVTGREVVIPEKTPGTNLAEPINASAE